MSELFERRMADPEVRSDTKTLGDFSAIYCKGVHRGEERRPLQSDAAALGAYGVKPPMVCDECAELLRYAEKRRAFCPKDPKPFCSYCDSHCYKADMSERMRQVMVYAGPRSMFHGYAREGIRHLIEGRKAKAEAARRAAEGSNTEGERR